MTEPRTPSPTDPCEHGFYSNETAHSCWGPFHDLVVGDHVRDKAGKREGRVTEVSKTGVRISYPWGQPSIEWMNVASLDRQVVTWIPARLSEREPPMGQVKPPPGDHQGTNSSCSFALLVADNIRHKIESGAAPTVVDLQQWWNLLLGHPELTPGVPEPPTGGAKLVISMPAQDADQPPANPLNEPPTWRLSIGDCVDIDSGPKLGGPPRRGFIVGLYMCGDGHLQASWRDLDTSSGGCPARSMTPRGWGWTAEERTNIVNQIRGDDEWLTDDRRKRLALLCRKHPGVEVQRLEYPMLDECPLCKIEKRMADPLPQRDCVPCLPDDRIAILASRAGGHAVGAPATRDEERSMAVEVQCQRLREKSSEACVDEALPEDEAIQAAHPLENGRHDRYEEALRLVGAKRSKGALVELVNWLLSREVPRAGDVVQVANGGGRGRVAFVRVVIASEGSGHVAEDPSNVILVKRQEGVPRGGPSGGE